MLATGDKNYQKFIANDDKEKGISIPKLIIKNQNF
jgi:hypothetical protein